MSARFRRASALMRVFRLRTLAGAGAIAACLLASTTLGAAGCARGDADADSSTVAARGASDRSVSREDSALVAVGRSLASVMPRASEMWPGFAPPALLVYRHFAPPAALLISRDAPKGGFDRVVAAKGTTPGLFLRHGELPGLTGNIALEYAVGGTTATAVPWGWQPAAVADDAFHEAFHTYQRARFAGANDGDPFIADSTVAIAPFIALGEVEQHLLGAALGEANPERSGELLRQFAAVRRRRWSFVSAEVVAAQRRMERIEGTAFLVGREAAALSAGQGESSIDESVRDALTGRQLKGYQGRLSDLLIRRRSYALGGALARLLDRAGVNWRRDVEAGASLDSLLEATVSSRKGGQGEAELVAVAKRNAGYDTLVTAARRLISSSTPRLTRASFDSLPGFRLIIEAAAVSRDGRLRFPSWNASGVLVEIDPATRAYHPARSFAIREPGLVLEAVNRPVMVEQAGAAPMRIVVVLPSAVRLNGGSARASEPVSIASEGISVRAEAARVVASGPDSLRLEVQVTP